MRAPALAFACLLAALPATIGEPQIVRPFEREGGFTVQQPIDALLEAAWRASGIEPARPCSDEVFLRRVFLDVIGTLPTPREVGEFLKDERPDKRARLIDALLEREEFADLWALKWCDLARVKAEFPINLWPNAVQAYHRWIRDAVRSNRPYDQWVKEWLTASGSNFRVPAVNFYRAVQGRTPAAIAEAVALTFLGTRLDRWPEERRKALAAFFTRVAYKKTAEWKEEIVLLDPAPAEPVETTFPDGTRVTLTPDRDPREVFAEWLTGPKNPWLARAVVNRIWSWLLGRGLVHEPDDLRPDNPASCPEALDWLESELRGSGFDLRHVYRRILNSSTYQLSSIPRSTHAEAAALFAAYPVRRLDAEVLIDALCWIGGDGESYTSPIPEPYTHIPKTERSIELADGSITSPFLEAFGRPSRDTGLESERNNQPSDEQRLYLLNSTDVQRRIQKSPWLRMALDEGKKNPRAALRLTWLVLLSRPPTAAEMATAVEYHQKSGLNGKQVLEDLAWALINSKEFLYRH